MFLPCLPQDDCAFERIIVFTDILNMTFCCLQFRKNVVTCCALMFLQNFYAPEPDPEMKIENYERSYEQNEILGLNDMKTENYAND